MAIIRTGISTDRPVTHALILGVSSYPNVDGPAPTPAGIDSGLASLSSAARSASEIAAWLLTEFNDPAAPLATIRILLSPTSGEDLHPAVAPLLTPPFAATIAAITSEITGFRQDCRSSVANRAFVYVAGHGVQLTKAESTILAEDFASPGQAAMLSNAVDMVDLHAAFRGDDFPAKQAWFVDACRQRPAAAWEFDAVHSPKLLDHYPGDVESSPLFLSSSTGGSAFASIRQSTFFSEAILGGLRGRAATGPTSATPTWTVSVSSMATYLPVQVRQMASSHGEDQRVDVTGKANDSALHYFAAPPDVDLRLDLSPAAAAGLSTASLFQEGPVPVFPPASDWPVQRSVAAGLYTLTVDTSHPYAPIPHRALALHPPSHVEPVVVGP